MATVQSSPYPSYEEIRSNYQSVVFCDDFKRLFWPLEGVFPERFAVMKSRKGALEAMEPFLQSDGTWHEIASLPLTEPKISSVMASVPLLDEYEAHWAYFHELHDEAEFVTYGDLEDEQRPYAQEQKEDGSWEEDSDTKYLARCCGQDRPLNKWNKKLKVLPSPGKDFVSVYDYVSAVHPWLMSLREDIIEALIVRRDMPVVWRENAYDTEYMICTRLAPRHEVDTKADWSRRHSPPPPLPPGMLERLRRSRQEGLMTVHSSATAPAEEN